MPARLAFRFLALLFLLAAGWARAAVPCEGLTGTTLPNARVLAAATVPAGSFAAPDGATYTGLPSFCKVSVAATPTQDSLINIELWLPAWEQWNGRFEGVGNGGYAGTIAVGVPAMVVGLRRGFAVATTDMGTAPSANNNADLLVGHPQKWEDWGHRATHLMAVLSKQLMTSYYDRGPSFSYFNGCSTGGQQGLMAAQRYPEDFDGILVGDAASNRTHVHTGLLWNFAAQKATPGSKITGSDVTRLITAAVVKACAAKSGGLGTDAFLTDPRTCDWDPAELQCSSALATNCLSPDQVVAVRKMYAGPVNPATGRRIFPGSTRGAETDSLFGWQSQGNAEPQFGSLFKWVFGLTFQPTAFDFDRDMASVDQLLAPILNANSVDLSAFRARGGKLLHYQGTADPLVPAQDAINYYHRVAQGQNGSFKVGLDRTRQFYRLFMVPGMAHCAFGPGPNAFGNLFSGQVTAPEPPSVDPLHDAMTALQAWVEGGTPPDRLVATKYVSDQPAMGIDSQRPICAYPAFPKYVAGDPKSASSFACVDNGNASNAALNPMPASEYLR